MALDHAFYNALRADVEAAFSGIAEKHGLKSLELGRITVDPMGGFRASLSGLTRGAESPEERNYNISRTYSDYVLPAIGEPFAIGNVRGRVTGQATRGNQRVQYTRDDGKKFLCPFESFERRFPRKEGERPSERAMRLASAPGRQS